MWKSLNDALGDLVLLGSSSVTDDDDEGGGGDGKKDDEDGEAKTEEEDEEEEEEGRVEGDDRYELDEEAILNDISSGIEEAASLMKRGGGMIWSGMTTAADVIISSVVEDGAALSGDDDEYYLEGEEEEEEGADWDAKEGGETMIGRMNSADDERGDHDVDGDTGEEVDRDESESEGIDDEEEEVLFLYSSPRPPRKHVALELESLDVVKMRRRLMEAEEQRNVLMQMVERRNEEICKLRCVMEQRRQRDSAIRHLEREVEWWNHMVAVCSEMTSTATDDSVNQRRVDSVNELKSILNQMRGHGDAASDNADRSIGDSIKASEERIRELKSSIQATKNRISPHENYPRLKEIGRLHLRS
jgi:hypothetical protein